MSNNSNHQYSSYSSSSYSYCSSYSSSSQNNGEPRVSGHRASQQSYTDPSGHTTVRRSSQRLGEPVRQDERQFDAQGREMIQDGADGASRRITDVDEEEKEKEKRTKQYEDKIEDEYAKREGGA